MLREDILKHVDHTVLNVTATWSEIKRACDEALKYSAAAVCIPPSYVKAAAEYLGGRLNVCTVIGFPNGYNTTEVKCYEAANAVSNGADELDMVINQGWVKEGLYNSLTSEISAIKAVCGDRILKVIVETCNLTEGEKVSLTQIVSQAGADYVKTSTGFGGGGAAFEDIELIHKACPELKIKASGGIGSFEDAEKLLELGASRLGTSKLIGIFRGEQDCQ